MKRGKVKLLIIACDVSENTLKKMVWEAEKSGARYRVYGKIDELSHITGYEGRGVFGITGENFSDIITKEIDEAGSREEEEF